MIIYELSNRLPHLKSVNIAKDNRYVYRSKPITKKKFKNPCGICHKSVNDNQKAILCNTCDLWIHRKCNGTTVKEYEMYCKEDDNIPWMCILCSIDELASKFPFGYLSKLELNDLFGTDLPSQLELLPSYELRSKLSQIPNLNDFDIEENYVQTINSKYYDLHDFNNLTASIGKGLSFFHLNIRSLAKHLDELKTILSMSKKKYNYHLKVRREGAKWRHIWHHK